MILDYEGAPRVIAKVLTRGGRRARVSSRKRVTAARCWRDAGRGPRAKGLRWRQEAGKGKEAESPPKLPEAM